MKHWSYGHQRHGSHGTMRCTACNQMIEDGEYRYRQRAKRGDWGYVAQHRACSEDDPEWSRMDAAVAAAHSRWAEFVADCQAFKERWREFGVTELDDYIGEQA